MQLLGQVLPPLNNRGADIAGNQNDIRYLMDQQCTRLVMEYRMHKRYPAPSDTFEEALSIYQNQENDYNCSGLWGGMLQWMVLMDQGELYEKCKWNLQEDFKDVTKCVWFLRAEEELKLYDAYAMNLAGDGTCFEVEDDFESLQKTDPVCPENNIKRKASVMRPIPFRH